jgi:two-component system sensor kinase FixL
MNIALLAVPAAVAACFVRLLSPPRRAMHDGMPPRFDASTRRPALHQSTRRLLWRAKSAAQALESAGPAGPAQLPAASGSSSPANASHACAPAVTWHASRAVRWKEWLARVLRAPHAEQRTHAYLDSFSLLECAPVAAFVLDAQGQVMCANAHAERLFHGQQGQLSGLGIDMLVPHLWSAVQRDAQSLQVEPAAPVDMFRTPPSAPAAAPALTRETRAKRRDGSDFPAQVVLHPIAWQGASAMLGFVCDRTESYELKRDRQELAHLTRVSTLGELAGSLAHELNQPLTAILSNVQAAQRFIEHEPPDLAEVRDILNDIVDDSCRASEVIRRIRAFVKKEELELVRLDIGGVLRDVVQLVHSDAIVRGVHLSLDVDEHLPPVRGDKVQLQQVMLNLIVNAFDAVRDVDPLDRVVTAFAGRDRDGMIRVAVRDRGHGMSADRLERIFKPFVTSKAQGLGLGLSISRSIVEMHRGRLWAEKNSDQGMTFHVTLPPWNEPATARATE